MNPLNEIRLILFREWRRQFRSSKGIVLAVLSVLVATLISIGLAYLLRKKREMMPDASIEQMKEMKAAALVEMGKSKEIADFLAGIPDTVLALWKITIFTTPWLVLLLGYDSLASDVQHRTIRFWTVRTRKVSYFLGKWLGLFTSIALIHLVITSIVLGVVLVMKEDHFSNLVRWGLELWVFTLPVTAAWTGLATGVGSFFRTPMVALLSIFGTYIVFGIVAMIGAYYDNVYVSYFWANNLDEGFLLADLKHLGIALGVALAYAALPLSIGAFAFSKRDV